MKKSALIILSLLVTAPSFSQIKNIKATSQKTFGGMGGIFMNYIINFNCKPSEKIEIDSVKSIADSLEIRFGFTKFDPCCKNEISFNCALAPPAKCKTCRDEIPKQPDLIKGVIVYWRSKEKKSFFKVKKFKRLEDLKLP